MPSLSLPIDPLLPEIAARVKEAGALVVEAPPGAGKTTRVPRALLEAGVPGEIVVLQPRRLPARLAAARVAEEMGEPLGKTVGYTVRFEDVGGAGTRLRFVTEGVLVRRLLADPELAGVGAVVLDEFHERHIATDLGLGLLARLRTRRPGLRLCVMSATLDAEPIASYLDDCPRVRSEGRLFDVAVSYDQGDSTRRLEEQVAGAVRGLVRDGLEGDVLVFLPGAGEIRRATEALGPLAQSANLLLLPLHGDLSPAEQARAVGRADRRKVILSTNVAETSVTIDGVVAVVDSGLARIAGHSPFSGLSTLAVGKVSQAAAIQRAGRAGRTRPGRALRLYTRHDFESRRSYELPEVSRLDLAEPVLTLAALGIREATRFPWFEPPPAAALGAASELLRRLGAVDAGGAVTEVGRAMLRLPLHPRLARLVVEGERRGVGGEAATLAALIEERDVEERSRVQLGPHAVHGPSDNMDLLERLDRLRQAGSGPGARDRLRGLGLDPRAVEAVERSRRQIAGIIGAGRSRLADPHAIDEALGLATLAGFPDRVMRRRSPGAREAVLTGGGAAAVGALPPDDLLVAVDAEERVAGPGKARGVLVRLAVAVAPEALLDVVGDAVLDKHELRFNPGTERVDELTQLAYGQIVLEETRRPAPPSAEASRVLAAAARAAGFAAFVEPGALEALRARVALLREALGESAVVALDDDSLAGALEAACEGVTSFAELRAAGLPGLLADRADAGFWQRLRAELPDRLRLPGGREVTINYPPDRPPFIESRLQDFFGMKTGPAIARGRIAIVLHLCAPNGRAVQVTRDLAGFWREHYPSIRRELSRRYPRHAWPEDGATATPPTPKPPRPR